MNTLGERIAQSRKAKGYTQESLADKLGVSAQAVSKWENDISCPDITLLPDLAKLLGVSVDALLSGETHVAQFVPEELRKPSEEIMLRIYVNDSDGDKVKINLPLPFIKACVEIGVDISSASGNSALKGIDMSKVIEMAEKGMIGKIMEVESGDGDTVEIVIE